MSLETVPQSGYHSPVTEKNVIGIDVPNGAANSRTAQCLAAFYRLGAPSFGQPGGRGRKARRCSIGTPTPVRSAHPIGVGLAVHNRNWSNIMRQSTPTGAPRAVVIPFPRFSQPDHRKADIDFRSSDFDAGFEFAMAMVRHLKAHGQLHSLKGV